MSLHTSESIRKIVREAGRPLSAMEIRELEPEATHSYLWEMTRAGFIVRTGIRKAARYTPGREARPWKASPEQKAATAERKRQRERERYAVNALSMNRRRAERLAKARASKPPKSRPGSLPIEPSRSHAPQPKPQTPPESYEAFIARGGTVERLPTAWEIAA